MPGKLIKRCFFLLFFLSAVSYGSDRSYYAGDLIIIKLHLSDLSEKDLLEKFKDFSVEKIERLDKGYRISLRSFKTGVREVKIGSFILKFDIKSVLNDYPDRKDIFDINDAEKEKVMLKPEWPFPLTLLLLLLFSGIIGFVIFIIIKQNKQNSDPVQSFRVFSENLPAIDDEYFFHKLTYSFKQFLEMEFGMKALDKTTRELIHEIRAIDAVILEYQNLTEWLAFFDRCKYAKSANTAEERKDLIRKIRNLCSMIYISNQFSVHAKSADKKLLQASLLFPYETFYKSSVLIIHSILSAFIETELNLKVLPAYFENIRMKIANRSLLKMLSDIRTGLDEMSEPANDTPQNRQQVVNSIILLHKLVNKKGFSHASTD